VGVQHTSQSCKNVVYRANSLKYSMYLNLDFTPIDHKNAQTTLLYNHTRDIVKTNTVSYISKKR